MAERQTRDLEVWVWILVRVQIFLLKFMKRRNSKGKMIKNILKRREESNTCLTNVCRHRRSRQITMKMDETGAFSQHCGFHQLYLYSWWKPQYWLKAPVSSIFIVICLLRWYIQTWVIFLSWMIMCVCIYSEISAFSCVEIKYRSV